MRHFGNTQKMQPDVRKGRPDRKAENPYGKESNRRKSTLLFLAAAVLILAAVRAGGVPLEGRAAETGFTRDNLEP